MISKFLGLTVVAAVISTLSVPLNSAHAAPIAFGSQINVGAFSGTSFDLDAHTVIFPTSSDVGVGGQTGSFTALTGTINVDMLNEGATTNYLTDLIGNVLFTATEIGGDGTVVSLLISTANVIEGVGSLTIEGTGFLSLTGFDLTEGTFRVTTQAAGGANSATNVSFSSTAAAVPGPIVGAGLPGLIIACGGLIALARRRRRHAVA